MDNRLSRGERRRLALDTDCFAGAQWCTPCSRFVDVRTRRSAILFEREYIAHDPSALRDLFFYAWFARGFVGRSGSTIQFRRIEERCCRVADDGGQNQSSDR